MADSAVLALLAKELLGNPDQGLAQSVPYSSGINLLKLQPTANDRPMGLGESLLAGALQGLVGGGLMGYGKNQVESENTTNSSDLVKAMMETDPTARQAIFDANPSIAPYSAILKVGDWQHQQNLEDVRTKIAAENASKAPTLLSYIDGTQEIQKRFDPTTGAETIVGQGPRYKFDAGNSAATKPLEDALIQKYADKMGIPFDKAKELIPNQQSFTDNMAIDSMVNKQAAIDKKGDMFGFEDLPGASPLTPATKDKLDLRFGATQQAIQTLDEIKNIKDPNQLTGIDAAKQAALGAEMFQAIRRSEGLQSRFPPAEVDVIKNMIPKLAANDFTGAMKALVLDKQGPQVVGVIQDLLKKSFESEMLSYGKKSVSTPLSDYSPSSLQRLGIAKGEDGSFYQRKGGHMVQISDPNGDLLSGE